MVDIAKLLHNVPSGTKLYSPIYGVGKLYKVTNGVINVKFPKENNHKHFDRFGRFSTLGECVLFPSQDCRDWREFKVPMKEGDIIAVESLFNGNMATWLCVYNGKEINTQVRYHIGLDLSNNIMFDSFYDLDESSIIRHASQDERNMFISILHKHGYDWNKEEQRFTYNNSSVLVFQPFCQVLVRNNDNERWGISNYSHFDRKYVCINNQTFNQCIPFNDATKHLVGTTQKVN